MSLSPAADAHLDDVVDAGWSAEVFGGLVDLLVIGVDQQNGSRTELVDSAQGLAGRTSFEGGEVLVAGLTASFFLLEAQVPLNPTSRLLG